MTTAKNIRSIMTFVIVGTTACNSSDRNKAAATKLPASTTAAVEIASQPDSFAALNSAYPQQSLSDMKVLTVGTFHNEEVWPGAAQGNWLGLFRDKEGYYIAPTSIHIQRVTDEIVDEQEDEPTGWKVRTENKDSAIILAEGNYLKPNRIKEAMLAKAELYPGDTLSIVYAGINYKFFATGNKKKMQAQPEGYEVSNYKLYLIARINGRECKSLLAAQENFDDRMIRLLFAGDMDGDGILDLVIDTSRHYNVTSPTVYLSKPAPEGAVVKPVGVHTSVGC